MPTDAGSDAGNGDAGVDAGAPQDTCEAAVRIGPGSHQGSTLGARNDYAPSCTGSPEVGPDVAFVISVPAGQRLEVSAAPAPGSAFDVSLYLVMGPASRCAALGTPGVGCLAGADASSATAAVEQVSWLNDTGAAADVFALVDSSRSGLEGAGAFTLSVALVGGGDGGQVMMSGETCEAAIRVGAGSVQGSTVGARDDYSPTCTGWANPGPDRAYVVRVPAGQQLDVTATPAPGSQYDLSLYLAAAPPSQCGALTAGVAQCLASADNPSQAYAAEQASWFNTSSLAADVFVVVDSSWSSAMTGVESQGDFTLAVALRAPGDAGVTDAGVPDAGTPAPPRDTCATAQRVTPGTVQGTTVGAADDYAPTCTGFANPGPDVAYVVSVPAGQRLVASVAAAAGSGFDPSVYLVAGPASACGGPGLPAPTCLSASDDPLFAAATESVAWDNTTSAAVDVYVIVDSSFAVGSAGSAAQGPFALSVTVGNGPGPGDLCGAPQVLPGAVTLSGQSLAGYSADYPVTLGRCVSRGGADRVYAVDVPPGVSVVVSAAPTGGATTLDPTLSLALSPGACFSSCETGIDGVGPGAAETLAWTNPSAMTKRALVVVGSGVGNTGTFTLSVALQAPVAGDTCEAPPALSPGVTVPGQTTQGLASDFDFAAGGTCAGPTSGPDRAYSLSVPAGQRARVTVTPSATFAPTLNLLAGDAGTSACTTASATCLAGGGAPQGQPVSSVFFNTGLTAQPVLALVDGVAGGTFGVGYALDVPAANDTCATAQATLTPGVLLSGQSLNGFVGDYLSWTSTCVASQGADRAYLLSVPDLQRVDVTVTPSSMGFDPVVSLLPPGAAACEAAGRACLASNDLGVAGETESASWTNSTGAARQVYVVVGDAQNPSPSTSFAVGAQLSAPAAGETCRNALPLMAGATTGTLTNASREYVLPGGASGCAQGFWAERVYAISLGVGQTLDVVAQPVGYDGGLAMDDVVLNLLAGPATQCTAATSCLASANANFGGVESLQYVNGATAQTVYLLVSGTPALAYSLQVSLR